MSFFDDDDNDYEKEFPEDSFDDEDELELEDNQIQESMSLEEFVAFLNKSFPDEHVKDVLVESVRNRQIPFPTGKLASWKGPLESFNILEKFLCSGFTGNAVNGAFIIQRLVIQLKEKYADKILFGLIDNIYLQLQRTFTLEGTGGGIGFKFEWSEEPGRVQLELPSTAALENDELLYLIIGDMLLAMIDLFSASQQRGKI